jgi:hypothetical protein
MRDSFWPASRIGYTSVPNLIVIQMLNQRNPVKPSGPIPMLSRIEVNPTCSYSVSVFGSAFCLAQSPLTAPFCFIKLAARESKECTGEPRNTQNTRKRRNRRQECSRKNSLIQTFLCPNFPLSF